MSRIAVTVLVAMAFVGGLTASRLLERDARAQPSPSSTVYVPADGLAFRSFDGRVVARLSYDSHGGVFEVYDGHQMPAAMLRTSGNGELREPSSYPAPRSVAQSPRAPTVDSPSHKNDIDLGI